MWAAPVVLTLVLTAIFFDGLEYMGNIWFSREEYSHGVLIPFVSLFLIWQQKDILERIPYQGTWFGVGVITLGLTLFAAGELSTLYVLEQYALVAVLLGIALTVIGWQGFAVIRAPMLLLIFMIPLPNFILEGLSSKLQLISSALGVWVIRLLDISVFLEGNVIDLGGFKLQVVEACSGLRYLFPLMTVGFIAAYFYKAAFWKRAVVFLSSIPITIFMNSFRIGAIGVMVEYWGKSMATGFLHDFEGWVVFMACMGVLVLEMAVLAKIGTEGRPWRELFGIEMPAPTPKEAQRHYRAVPRPFIAGVVVLTGAAIVTATMPERTEIVQPRKDFAGFPLSIEDWRGKTKTLESVYLDVLKLDDYIVADFVNDRGNVVNFYSAYYVSQRKGESAHSPRSCIPGDGWEIAEIGQHEIEMDTGNLLKVNRTVIKKGDVKQVVYYWFLQRGRNITNEYLVKWYLFYDALTKNRTDGALVRLTTPIMAGESIDQGDERLERFLAALAPKLEEYIPR